MNFWADTVYHKVLRVSAAVVASVLVFQSGLLSEHTRGLAEETRQYLGSAVGMSARVQPTQLNTLTAEVTQQKLALADREAAVAAREIEIKLAAAGEDVDYATYILAGILLILLILIVLNYVLDYLRHHELEEERA